MKNFLLFPFILLFTIHNLSAQVSISPDSSPADNSAMLDVKSSNKGFLPPRVALISINSSAPVTAPATGLLVYNTAIGGTSPNNVVQGYYYWNGLKWVSVAPPQGTNVGDMQYWNGTQWVNIPVGANGQMLILSNGVPIWGTAPSLLDGLLAWYPFNGNAIDGSGNRNNGTVYSATLTTDRFGNSNSAYSFNGTNNYINIPFPFGNSSEFSTSVWVKLTGLTGSFQAIISSTSDCFEHLQCFDSGNIGFYTNNGGNVDLPIISLYPQNTWRHIVFSIKSGMTKVYENSILVSQSNATFDYITLATQIRIGSGYSNVRFLKGTIDDVRFYNRALTNDEVSSLYHEGGWQK